MDDHSAGGPPADECGKDRKSFEFSIDGSGMKIEASQFGNLMCFINDHRGIEDEHNAAYVEVAINGFPVILVIACKDIEARYVTLTPQPISRSCIS